LLPKELTVLGKIYLLLTPFRLLRALLITESFYSSLFKLSNNF